MSDLMELLRFVMEKAPGEPVARQAKILRGLAAVCGDEADARKLQLAAVNLETAESLCRDLNTSFIQKKLAP